jgi:cell wall-associated NlpC family hydrolase
VHNHALIGARRYLRARAVGMAVASVVVSGSVALASPASAAPATRHAFVSAPGQSGPAGENSLSSAEVSRAVTNAAALAAQFALPQPTITSVWSNRTGVQPGDAVQLTGQVTYGSLVNSVGQQLISLQQRLGTSNSWTDVTTQPTSENGYVAFTVRPTNSVTYRLSYPGLNALAGSVSPNLTVTVANPTRPAVTAPPAPKVTSPSAGSVPLAASGRGAQVVAAAAAQAGKPYVFGAAGPNAFDCSGLTMYAFGVAGVNLPHNADAQQSYGTAVTRAQARPGDLIVFLDGGYGYHVAIYAGDGYMYDAPNADSTVGKRPIYSGTVIFRRLV